MFPHRSVIVVFYKAGLVLFCHAKSFGKAFPTVLPNLFHQSHRPTEPCRAWRIGTWCPAAVLGDGSFPAALLLPQWDEALELHGCSRACRGSSAMAWAPDHPPSCSFGASTSNRSCKDSFGVWHLRHFTARNSSLLLLSFHLPKAVCNKSQRL